jgi:hypothetical protein
MSLELGEAIWKVGQHSSLVRQRMSSFEREITFTDEQMGVFGSGEGAA